jgi:hypothetical protein
MLIRCNILETPIRTYEFISNNKYNNSRIDRLTFGRTNNNNNSIIKESYFNKDNGIQEFIKSEIDINSGEHIFINSGIVDDTRCIISDLDKNIIIEPRLLGLKNFTNNINYISHINYFEDDFNINYCNSIGILYGLLSYYIAIIPLRLNIIIDTDDGITIYDSKNVFNDFEIDNLIKKEKVELMKDLNILFKYIKDECIKEKRHLRIYCNLSDFSLNIQVKDKIYNEFDLKTSINPSDHCDILSSMSSCYGINHYLNSKTFEALYNLKLETILDTILDDIDGANFRNHSGETYFMEYYK